MMDERMHPETGKTLRRGARPQVIAHGDSARIIEVPGWYPDDDSDSIHSGEDLVISDRAFKELRAKEIPIVADRG